MRSWVLIAIFTVVAAAPSLLVGETNRTEAEVARREAAQWVHSIRYEWNGRVLPEGDFSRISEFQPENAAEFFAAGEEASAYYFRGFVGEIYTGDGWTDLPAAHKAGYATLFAWLHERGFYGQQQYLLLTEALGLAAETREIRVQNTTASARYLYAPYEAASKGGDKAQIGDENLPAAGLRGENGYTLSLRGGAILNDEQLYLALAAARQRELPEVIRYLANENAYRDFVYGNYLEIPEEAHAAIERFFGGLDLPEENIAFSDAKLAVNAYLNMIAYTDTPQQPYAGGDFVTYLLEDSKEGNSIHFASTAVLMFRYLGVPTRYVEGFRLTADEMEAAQARGFISLSAGKARAWAEIYRNGIGFVPFEMNPPDILPPDLVTRSMENAYIPPAEPIHRPQAAWLAPLLWLSALLCLLLLAAALFLVVRRAVKRRRIIKLLSVSDNAEAVSRITSYLIRVLSHADILYEHGSLYLLRTALESKFDENMGEKFAAVIRVQQAALFSGQVIDDAGRALAGAFLDEFIWRLQKRANLHERLRLKWIACVF